MDEDDIRIDTLFGSKAANEGPNAAYSSLFYEDIIPELDYVSKVRLDEPLEAPSPFAAQQGNILVGRNSISSRAAMGGKARSMSLSYVGGLSIPPSENIQLGNMFIDKFLPQVSSETLFYPAYNVSKTNNPLLAATGTGAFPGGGSSMPFEGQSKFCFQKSKETFLSQGQNSENEVDKDCSDSEFPYKCTVENCSKSYKTKNGLKYHRRHVHHIYGANGSSPPVFQCEQCIKEYRSRAGLKYHYLHSDCKPSSDQIFLSADAPNEAKCGVAKSDDQNSTEEVNFMPNLLNDGFSSNMSGLEESGTVNVAVVPSPTRTTRKRAYTEGSVSYSTPVSSKDVSSAPIQMKSIDYCTKESLTCNIAGEPISSSNSNSSSPSLCGETPDIHIYM
eukprot:Nk52_evm58s236 gene=Nk52_evmTU58s236